MIVKFDYWMHGSDDTWYEQIEDALEEHDFPEADVQGVLQNAQFPFYEIGYQCELDTETGVVTFKETP